SRLTHTVPIVLRRVDRCQTRPHSAPRVPRAVVTGLHGRPFHADGMGDVLLHAVSDETPFLRGQRVREEQRLAQSQGFLSHRVAGALEVRWDRKPWEDRKSTRLNSSHGSISYAVFCLKK